MKRPRFKSVVLDVDSTLCGIEGIDWLASLRDAGVAENVANATARAMRGESSLESVYADRLALVSPTRAELRQLAQAYRDSLSPGAREEIRQWREAGVHVVLVSGGLREAIAPVAAELGFLDEHLNALIVEFDENEKFVRLETSSPLYTAKGKQTLLHELDLPRPLLAVGDGVTDLAMKDIADAFAAYTGFVTRDAVVAGADHVVGSFSEISRLIFGD